MAEVRIGQIPESPRSGPILRACQSCAASKSKCVPATDETDGKCARCFKSKRECVYQVRTAKKRKPSSTTAELEQKVQTLAALLASQNAAVQRRSLPPTPESFQGGAAMSAVHDPHSQIRQRQLLPSKPEEDRGAPTPVSLRLNPETQNRGLLKIPSGPTSSFEVAAPSAEALAATPEGPYLLRIFRDHFSRRFPFIIVPPEFTAQELQIQRPWLFKAITIVASQDNRAQQLAWEKEFISELTIAIVVNSEKSLDMLQSLIIHTAWKYSYANSHASIINSAHSQLILSLVFDLGLNHPRTDSDSPVGLGNTSRSDSATVLGLSKPGFAPSMDEKRALLSVYFLTNMLAWSMKRIEGLEYSPYLDVCRRNLLANPENEADLVLASLVKIQAIIEKSERNFLECSHVGGEKTPIWLHSEIAVLELQAYWSSLSADLRQNPMLTTNYYAAISFFYEPCLLRSLFPRDLAGGNVNRVKMLKECLISTRRLLDYLLTIPISDYFTFSVFEIGCIRQGYVLLMRLSMEEEHGWNLDQFQEERSFREYFTRLRINMHQVGVAIDQNQPRPCPPSFFTSSSENMDKVKVWYNAKTSKHSQEVSSATQASTQILPPESSEMFDDRFWEDFMLGGSFF